MNATSLIKYLTLEWPATIMPLELLLSKASTCVNHTDTPADQTGRLCKVSSNPVPTTARNVFLQCRINTEGTPDACVDA